MAHSSWLKYDILKIKKYKKIILIFLTSTLLFSGIDKVFSQEWRIVEPTMWGEDSISFHYYETFELSNGNINIYPAFEDNGIITGSYTKEVSFSEKPRGNDSVFESRCRLS